MSSYYLLPVGVLGMIIALILSFIPRKPAEKGTDSVMPSPSEKKNNRLLSLLCIAHAVCLTAGLGYLFTYVGGLGCFARLPGKIWFVFLGLWPVWLVVFLMRRWKTHRIMITMLMGLVILSPLFLVFLILWALRNGASL